MTSQPRWDAAEPPPAGGRRTLQARGPPGRPPPGEPPLSTTVGSALGRLEEAGGSDVGLTQPPQDRWGWGACTQRPHVEVARLRCGPRNPYTWARHFPPGAPLCHCERGVVSLVWPLVSYYVPGAPSPLRPWEGASLRSGTRRRRLRLWPTNTVSLWAPCSPRA